MNVGILISPNPELSQQPLRKQLPEPLFYEQLHDAATQLNLTVYVFNANSFNNNSSFLNAYRYVDGSWIKSKVDYPDVVIDRTFHPSSLHSYTHSRFMKELEARHSFQYLNAQLPNKLIVYDMLKAKFASYIPPTIIYQKYDQLAYWLNQHLDGIILKPQSGMQGKGIIHIKKQDDQYVINGRQRNNQPIQTILSNRLTLQRWLLYFIQNTPYLLQPYFSLLTADEEPFDIRVLMQKNEYGIWQYSGHMARVGPRKNLTSNLHGGGYTLPSLTVLSRKFSHPTPILENIRNVSDQIVIELEACLGRFGELAIDYGVTNNGEILFLECNSKPGRQAFNLEPLLKSKVSLQPLLYAQYLFEHYKENKVKRYKSTLNNH